MSNKQMVSVPRELLETTISCAWDFDKDGSVAALQDWLDKPAEQHQGEPVALPGRREPVGVTSTGGYSFIQAKKDRGWNACLDELAKLNGWRSHGK